MVVGIFDFSSAFTLKQRLTNITRDAARASAVDPSNDLLTPSSAVPISVADVFYIIDNYLIGNSLNDCGLSTSVPTTSALTWTFTANNNGCTPPGLTLMVNRAYYFPATGAANPTVNCASQSVPAGTTAVIGTCVSLQYAYPWRFGRAASLLGASAALPTQISAVAVTMNEN